MSKAPKLRFKEFSGDWEEKKLGNYLIQYTDITTVNNQYPPLTSSRRGIFLQEEYFNKQVASKDNTGYNIVPRNYFTYRHMSDDSIFYFNINSIVDYGIVSTLYPVFTTDKSKLNSNYLKEYLNESDRFRKYSVLQKQGGSRTYMYFSKLKEFMMPIPKIEEQEKIASFFSLIDDKISLQGEKVEALKDYKRGMMQKIFSRELRFKDDDGRDYPEWEEKKLGDVLSIPEKIKEDNVSKDKLLTVKLHRKGIQINENTETLNIGATTYYKRKAGQIIYGKQNFFNGAIDIVPDKFDGFISSGDVPSLDVNKKIADIQFILNFIGRDVFYKRTETLATGTGSKRLHENVLFTINIDLPCLNEQKKIVNLLNEIDKKIEKEQEKLDSLNEYKKGLLQQMFV